MDRGMERWLPVVVVGWALAFGPKLIIFPIYRAMYRAMRATEALNAADDEWLEQLERDRRRGGGEATRVRRRRGPNRPRRPGGLGPVRLAQRHPRRPTPARRPPRVDA
jgi:hypothetical protein